jgi:hypothetical protein
LPIIGPIGVATAIASIDPAVGIEEEDHEGQVVVELEQVQVEVVDARQTDPDELVSNVFDLFETDNLPVKKMAVRSRDAAHDDHQWLAAFARPVLPLLQAGEPAVACRLCRVAPAPKLRRRRSGA